jgi:hypothetical protein
VSSRAPGRAGAKDSIVDGNLGLGASPGHGEYSDRLLAILAGLAAKLKTWDAASGDLWPI